MKSAHAAFIPEEYAATLRLNLDVSRFLAHPSMNPTRSLSRIGLLLAALSLVSCATKPEPTSGWTIFWVVVVVTIVICSIAGVVDAHNEADKKVKRATKASEGLDKIVTSSSSSLVGYHAVRHVKFISVVGGDEQDVAEIDFLAQVKAAGANGVINMKITRQDEDFLIEGDAVLVEPSP